MSAHVLLAGDVLVKDYTHGTKRYVVLGHTPRGKVRLLRDSGTEFTAWWSTTDHLPKGYRLRGMP